MCPHCSLRWFSGLNQWFFSFRYHSTEESGVPFLPPLARSPDYGWFCVLYVYIHIYVIHIYIIHVHIFIYTYIYTYIHMYIHTCTHIICIACTDYQYKYSSWSPQKKHDTSALHLQEVQQILEEEDWEVAAWEWWRSTTHCHRSLLSVKYRLIMPTP